LSICYKQINCLEFDREFLIESIICQINLIYMVFSKAFRHRLCLDKMLSDVDSSRWQGSFFAGRVQNMEICDCVSRDNLVTAGVPQDSRFCGRFDSSGL
jgi:hypothetical protein